MTRTSIETSSAYVAYQDDGEGHFTLCFRGKINEGQTTLESAAINVNAALALLSAAANEAKQ